MNSLVLAVSLLCILAPQSHSQTFEEASPGEPGGRGLAIRAAKILTLSRTEEVVVDNGVMLIVDGKISAVGSANEVLVPDDFELIDVGDRWLMPGLIELHCHVGSPVPFSPNDINDTVYLTNPGLRASPGVQPGNVRLQRGVAGGVTTALYIPGSGSNMGGQGVLLKIGHEGYQEMELRDPGSLKLAQAGNPEGWTVGVNRSFMNWNIRNTFQRGVAYAKLWEAFESGEGEEPDKDIQLEIFRSLRKNDAQISTHTQFGQVVMMTIIMVAKELKLPVFIDHGSFDGFRYADLAEEYEVPAILGPRAIARWRTTLYGWGPFDTDGKILGIAAEYQARGHTRIGFNTDCVDGNASFGTPPQEELSLQAAMAVRYGLKNVNLESLRGLTLVPAETVGLGERLGSLEAGKDADFLVLDGDVADPRTTVQEVYTDGKRVYDGKDGRLW
ncbi:MAG: imidazolonepropionase-like amidohydrolase [Planctomycetota bacterium]|jgi:imidazolonepropionase-like amidohydrolase